MPTTTCEYYMQDHYCGEPNTRRFINGHYCRLHTPGVISGLPPMTPQLWDEGNATWQGWLDQRATARASQRPRARRTDPATSHAAAASVRGTTATHTRIVYLLREQGPLTDEEIASAWQEMVTIAGWPKVSPSGLRTRRAELVDRGQIVDTGRTRLTKARRHTTVWGLPTRH